MPRADSGVRHGQPCASTQPGASIVPKRSSEIVERIVAELMDSELSKAERIQLLRDLARSGEDVPDELMDQALRKLMERITD
jgi:hypothetical protein